jgi:chemotaxis protein MotB
MSHGKGRSKKKQHHEEHVNHERWLVSYADMVTLLMCLFIVLFAMSQVDKDKYTALAAGLHEGFGSESPVLNSGKVAADPSSGLAAPIPLDIKGEVSKDGGSSKTAQQIEADAEQRRKARIRAEAENLYDNLAKAKREIEEALRKAGYPGSAHYQITERGLTVSIVADQVLFDSARADLRPEGRVILTAVAPTLRSLPNMLAIEGHTNHLPLRPGSRWPSDWELSTYRATTVLRYLSGNRLPEAKMFAAGFSDTRPLIDPAKPEAISQNRRVDIVILSTGTPEANRELADIARENGLGAARIASPSTGH